jgi:hypothetical protein
MPANYPQKVSCPSCDLLVLNNHICHERGCPDSHLYKIRECDWCGSEFIPECRDQRFCEDSCAQSYSN